MFDIDLFIEGKPIPKGRPRYLPRTSSNGKPFVQIYTPKTTQQYEKKVYNVFNQHTKYNMVKINKPSPTCKL